MLRRLRGDRRGGVAIIVGLSAVPLMMALCMGLELAHGTTVKAELQRTADLAALAGARYYVITNDAQKSATAAAMLAELNGGAGVAPGTPRPWNGTTLTLSDNQITAQIADRTPGVPSKAVIVTVRQDMPLFFSGIISPGSLTVSATGRATTFAQPCVLALSSVGSGIQAQGNPSVTLADCSMRSNSSISNGGSSSFSASGFYAAGSITGSETGGPLVPQDGTVADPYAGTPLVQNAINHLQLSGITDFKDKPGENHSLPSQPLQTSWTNWDIKGSVTLQPGIYYVYGPIKLGDSASLSGSGVTIVTTGQISMNGGSTVTLSAATTTSAQNGAIPGFVFIGTSSSDSTFGGNSGTTLTGAVYNPNGALNFAGTPQGGSSGCLQVVAKSIQFVGNSSMASACSNYGPGLTFSSETNATIALFK